MVSRTLPCFLVLSCLGAGGGTVRAGEADSPASPAEQLQRLEQVVAERDAALQALREQVAVLAAQDTDAARTAAMREQIRSILNEREFRESMMPSTMTAGYDDGFYIKSTDDQFSMNVNGLMQFRWTYYDTQNRNHYLLPRLERDDRTGFDIQRLRVALSGNLYNKDWTYAFELEQDSPDAYDSVLSEGVINYRLADELQFQAGYFRALSTRQQAVGDGEQQFIDRSLVDAVFGLGYVVGVRVWGQAFERRLEYGLDVVNGFANGENVALGRTITPDPSELDNNPGIAARIVWHALGDNPGNDFLSEADLERRESPALDFGMHYAFNEDKYDALTTSIPLPAVRRFFASRGGYGVTSTNGTQINQFGWDAAFQWQGFSCTGEYVLRLVDPRRADSRPFTPWHLLTGDGSTTAQHGGYVQVGYMLPIPGMENKLEAVARVGGISALASHQEGTWEYAGGLNYYINGNKVKLQTDVTKVYEVPIGAPYSSLASVNDDALVWRVQLQVAF